LRHNDRAFVPSNQEAALSTIGKRFHISHRATSKFKGGLRGYFEYRDLGIKRATRGKVVAHVIRARPKKAPHGKWDRHDCDVQFVYVLKGWADFEYEPAPRAPALQGSRDARSRLAGQIRDAGNAGPGRETGAQAPPLSGRDRTAARRA